MNHPKRHTLVLSDIHLTEAEPVDPARPLWKRYKHRDLFVDDEIAAMLRRFRHDLDDAPSELVLNGDVFDFDAVMAIPDPAPFPVSFVERRRGLSAEQDKSAFKMGIIVRDHPVFVAALREWILAGHHAIFIIGNHDLELHWPAVKRVFLEALDLPEDMRDAVRFCEFFYVSGGDTLLTHGNQYDRYCVCQDPLHPLVSVSGRPRVRLPFGDLAGKLMTNGMGLFNPHVEDTFIKPLREYIVFFYKVVARTQPLLVWSWFWSAIATLVVLLREGFRPPLRDPLTVEDRVEDVAARARSTPRVLRTLRAVDVHSAVFRPWMVARELWLDRALLFMIVAGVSWQAFTTLNAFTPVSFWWAVAVFGVLLPPFLFYAHGVESEALAVESAIGERLPLVARAADVRRVVMGHTHRARHEIRDGVEYLNTGTWSPAFLDVECTQPFGDRHVVWIAPDGETRTAGLYAWRDGELVAEPRLEVVVPPKPKNLRQRVGERVGQKVGALRPG